MAYSTARENQLQTSTLVVNIDGLQSNDGKVRIALSNSEESYSSDGKDAYRGGDAQITNKKALYTFTEVPYGVYAVKLFHDENNNDKLDSNFMGIPQEPYGFSNNARGTFGPASWDDAKFEIKEDSLVISITVQ